METNQNQYRLSFLWNYAINIVLVILVLIANFWNWDMPKLTDRLEGGISFLGVWMFLSLWGRSFIVDSVYKGKYALDSRTVKLFTFALVIIEIMTLYYSSFDHPDFFKPCLWLTIIWIAGFIGCVITNKNFIVKRLPVGESV